MRTQDDVNAAMEIFDILNKRSKSLENLQENPNISIGDLAYALERSDLRRISGPLIRQMAIVLIEQAIAGDKAKLLAMGIEVP